MKVKELIELLNEVEDKEKRVVISFDMGMATDDIYGLYDHPKYNRIEISSVN